MWNPRPVVCLCSVFGVVGVRGYGKESKWFDLNNKRPSYLGSGPPQDECLRRPICAGDAFSPPGALRRAGRAQLRDVGPRSFPPLRSGLSTPHISAALRLRCCCTKRGHAMSLAVLGEPSTNLYRSTLESLLYIVKPTPNIISYISSPPHGCLRLIKRFGLTAQTETTRLR